MDRVAYLAMKSGGTLPAKGDSIKLTREPKYEGVVLDTFYQNGEGGMHVNYNIDRKPSCSWTCCTDVEVTARAAP
jgi:hypothetical protein